MYTPHAAALSKVFSNKTDSCNWAIASSKSACSLSFSGDSDSESFTQSENADVPTAFWSDLSQMETATLPIVTLQARLQKIAYPALLQRRNRIDFALCCLVDFTVCVCFEGAKVSKKHFKNGILKEKVLLKTETPI